MNKNQKELIRWLGEESNKWHNMCLQEKTLVEKDLSNLSVKELLKNHEQSIMVKHYYALSCAYELCKRRVQKTLK